MPFVLPTFILNVNVWRAATGVLNPPDVVTIGNLAYGRRVSMQDEGGTFGLDNLIGAWLLLPKLVDVRDFASPGGADIVEVPAGSLRYYRVEFVDDLGKGFANEHRFAMLSKLAPWPAPIP